MTKHNYESCNSHLEEIRNSGSYMLGPQTPFIKIFGASNLHIPCDANIPQWETHDIPITTNNHIRCA